MEKPELLSPLSLAFVGDAVYSLWVREAEVARGGNIGALHSASVEKVNAAAQAKAAEKITEHLSEREEAIFKRGRNAQTGTGAKGATQAEYHMATGLEALFGWLYLSGQIDRARELFNIIF